MANDIEGRVVWFNNAKGFGFLSRESGADVFCHYSSIHVDGYKTLKEGELVRYVIVQGEKGPQAENVERVDAKHVASVPVSAPAGDAP